MLVAGALRFERRTSGLESNVLPVDTTHRGAGRTRTYEASRAPDLQSGTIAALPRLHIALSISVVKNQKESALAVPFCETTRSFSTLERCFCFEISGARGSLPLR